MAKLDIFPPFHVRFINSRRLSTEQLALGKRLAHEIAEESSIRSESAGFRPVDRGESRSREKSLHSADAKAHSTVTFHYPSRALSLVRDRAKLMDSSFFSPPPAPLITPLTHALDLLIVVFLPSFVGRLPRPINSPNAIPSFCSVSRGVAFFVRRNAIGFRSRKTGNC